jgi:hypothetical protein
MMPAPGVGHVSARSNGCAKCPRVTLKCTGSATPVIELDPFGAPGVGVEK